MEGRLYDREKRTLAYAKRIPRHCQKTMQTGIIVTNAYDLVHQWVQTIEKQMMH